MSSFDFFGDGGGGSGDEDDEDLAAFDDTGLLALASRERAERSAAASSVAASASSSAASSFAAAASAGAVDCNGDEEDGGAYEESDGGDWDNVDWEDADSDEHSDENGEKIAAEDTSRAFPAQGVMIPLGRGKSNDPDESKGESKAASKEEEGGGNKKRKRKTVRVLRSVPPETRRRILDVRRADLLCAAARCARQSSICGGGNDSDEDEERSMFTCLAYSLVPAEFHSPDTRIPAKEMVRRFAGWFFPFVNQAGRRRRDAMERNAAQGAAVARKKRRDEPNTDAAYHVPTPRRLINLLTYLSPRYDEDPQLSWEEEGVDVVAAVEGMAVEEKVLLFLAMVRSLGWRARCVASLRPIPLQLTVDHPLLALGDKPSQDERRLQKLLRLMHTNGMLAGTELQRGARERKRSRKAAKTDAKVEPIELLSSDEECDVKVVKKKGDLDGSSSTPTFPVIPKHAKDTGGPPHDSTQQLLSWVEVLCYSDDFDPKSMAPSKSVARWVPILPEQEGYDAPEDVESILALREAGGSDQPKSTERGRKPGKMRSLKSPKRQHARERSKKIPVSYVLAVEHPPLVEESSPASNGTGQRLHARFTDVTPRYANSWSRTLRLRGATGKQITAGGGECVDEWWEITLKQMNARFRPTKDRKSAATAKSPFSVTKATTASGTLVDVLELESSEDEEKKDATYDSDLDVHDSVEAKELTGNREKEKIPTSKAGFKQSPFFVIQSVLNSQDVLHPDARKRICGVFKGEMVYRRSDVSKALRAKKWLYQGRKVKESELERPVKQVKARKKPVARGFKQLSSYGVSEEAQNELIVSMDKKEAAEENEMDSLYGVWQTEKWSPPYVGPSDAIPTNEYRNVELTFINPGLTHMDQPRLAGIARKLGLPYAPCLLGYEGHGGNRTPTIRGIVVHDHNVDLLRAAYIEWESHAVEKAEEERRKEVLKRWKRLVKGILVKERLEREYG